MNRSTPRHLLHYVTRRLRLRRYLKDPGDGRQQPQIPAQALLWALLMGQILRQSSFHAVEVLVRSSARRTLSVATPFCDDTLGYFTERLDPGPTRQALLSLVRSAKRNKAFDDCRWIGLAIDGTGAGWRTNQGCNLCRPKQNTAKQILGYQHSFVMISVVGTGNGVHQDRLVKKLRRQGIQRYEATNEYLEGEYLAEHNRRFAREAARAENYHVRAPSTAKLREIFRWETERSISNDWVVPYRGHFLQLQPQNRHYGPTKAKALVCEWKWGGRSALSRRMHGLQRSGGATSGSVPGGPSKPRGETAKSVGSKPAQDHPWRQGYEQRMKLQKLRGSQVSALVGESASASP